MRIWSRLFAGSSLSCLLSGVVFLNGCSHTPPPPPCYPAIACAATYQIPNQACAHYGGQYGSGSAFSWQGKNNHPTRQISVTYQERVQYLNQGKQDDLYLLQYNEAPGGANPVNLGCQFVQVTDFYNQYTFTPVTACFTDDPICTSPALIKPAQHDCSESCNPPNCIKININRHDPGQGEFAIAFDKAVAPIFSGVHLTKIDLGSILSLHSICPNRGQVNIVNGMFSESGSTCRQYFVIDSTRAVLVTLPPRLAGIANFGAGGSFNLDFNEKYSEPILEWFEGSQSQGQETVERIEIGRHTVKIIGKLHYCITVYIPGD